MGSQIVPAVDFGHLHALSGGKCSGKPAYAAILDQIEKRLGKEVVKYLHIHFSPVEYTGAGEKKHWTTLETGFGPDFAPLAELIVERELQPTIICESNKRQAEDAAIYRDIYEKIKAGSLI
jgi:deoxyribonuclease-4